MTRKKITIVSGLQISDNPRVYKEAETLSSNGYDVTVLSAIHRSQDRSRNEALVNGRNWKCNYVVDASSHRFADRAEWFMARCHRKLAREMYRWTGLAASGQLGYANRQLWRACRQNPADLYILHVEQSLSLGKRLIQLGAKVAVDMEDWYSEDLCEADRIHYPMEYIRQLESWVLKRAVYSSTTSHAMSSALAASYDIAPPAVVYNAFPLAERKGVSPPVLDTQRNGQMPSLCWVSQVIGPDRGLEQLVAATEFLQTPIAIHLTGNVRPGMESALRKGMDTRCQIHFEPQVPHRELVTRMRRHDIGFAGELADNRNKDLTISNKLLHYFVAGIPAVVSDTTGQLEICRDASAATRSYKQRDPRSLAAAIDSWTSDSIGLSQAKEAAWNLGTNKYCWEQSEPVLLDAVGRAMAFGETSERR